MYHGHFVREIVSIYSAKSYLELGVANGGCFGPVCNMVNLAVGVDTVYKMDALPPNAEFYECTTNEFFDLINKRSYDVIFIDADHSVKSLKRDLENSLAALNRGGIILLHDTDPESSALFHPQYCDDAYKIVDVLSEMGLHHITLPMDNCGMTLISRDSDRRVKSLEDRNE